MVKRITKWRPVAVRRIGRPRTKWEVEVRQDLGKTKIRNWGKTGMEREASKRIVDQARTHKELYRQEKKTNH
jgi:hypothetical protein